jgi:hypothetical protein
MGELPGAKRRYGPWLPSWAANAASGVPARSVSVTVPAVLRPAPRGLVEGGLVPATPK